MVLRALSEKVPSRARRWTGRGLACSTLQLGALRARVREEEGKIAAEIAARERAEATALTEWPP